MIKRVTKALCCGALVASMLVSTDIARAAEGVVLAGPLGGSDIGAAILPPPGLYGALGYAYSWGTQLTDGMGNSIPGYDISANDAILAFTYVYDVDAFGGRIASSAVQIFSAPVCLRLGAAQQCSSGPTDPYVDLFFWSRFFPSTAFAAQPKGGVPIPFGWTIGGGMGLAIPVGIYDKSNLINPGAHIWDLAPNVALTYTQPGIIGDATEFSTRIFWNQYLQDTATHYTSGPILDINFAISEQFNAWKVGLTGDYHVQMADDIDALGHRVLPDGKRDEELKLGPVADYVFLAGGRPWDLRAKVLLDVWGKNAAGYSSFIVSLGTKFF